MVKEVLEDRFHDWEIQTWEDKQANFLRAVETEKRIMMVILCFIVIIAVGLILATLTLMVMEKVRDIGIMKALGGTTRGIMSIFLMNGFFIGGLGRPAGPDPGPHRFHLHQSHSRCPRGGPGVPGLRPLDLRL